MARTKGIQRLPGLKPDLTPPRGSTPTGRTWKDLHGRVHIIWRGRFVDEEKTAATKKQATDPVSGRPAFRNGANGPYRIFEQPKPVRVEREFIMWPSPLGQASPMFNFLASEDELRRRALREQSAALREEFFTEAAARGISARDLLQNVLGAGGLLAPESDDREEEQQLYTMEEVSPGWFQVLENGEPISDRKFRRDEAEQTLALLREGI